MSQPVPPQPGQQSWSSADQLNAAYRQGFLDGYLAGWSDAAAKSASTPAQRAEPLNTEPQYRTESQRPGPATKSVPQNINTLPAPQPSPSSSVPVQTPFRPKLPVDQQTAQPHPVDQYLSRPYPANPNPVPPYAALPYPVPPRPVAPRPIAPYPARTLNPANRALDPTALAARKLRRESQNINITLYIACLLLVAAAALFIGSSAPTAIRLVGVWTATALFYGVGLALHSKIARLRPAAVAFTGTALAIVPFAGLATYNLGFPDAPAVWLLTSVVGTFAYVGAAVKLNSKLIVFLSLGFFLSTAWSSVAVLGAALAWYFTTLIVFSAVLVLIGRLLHKQDASASGKASLYARPLAALGPWFAPTGLIASLVFSLQLNAGDRALVLFAGVIYYAIMTWLDAKPIRVWNYLGLRLSLTLLAPFAGWMVGESLAYSAGALTVVLSGQLVVVALGRKWLGSWLGKQSWPDMDVFIGIPLAAVFAFGWAVGLKSASYDAGVWVGSPALAFVVVLLAAAVAVPALQPRGEWLPAPAVVGMVLSFWILKAEDWVLFLSVALAYSLVRFFMARSGRVRQVMLVAARVLITGLAAATMAAYIPAQASKTVVIIAVLAVIAAGQLLADTLIGRFGTPNPVTAVSGTAWAVVGTGLVVLLAAIHTGLQMSAKGGLIETAQGSFVLAGVAMAGAVCVHSMINLSRDGAYVPAELMALSYLIIVGFSTGFVFDAVGAVVAWSLSTLFLVAMTLRLRGQACLGHRWAYWRGARIVSLFLAIGLFQWWHEHESIPALWGGQVTWLAVLVVALVIQLLILSGALVRNNLGRNNLDRTKKSPYLGLDVLLTLAMTVAVAGGEALTGALGDWTSLSTLALAAAGIAAIGIGAAWRLKDTDSASSDQAASNSEIPWASWSAFGAQSIFAALFVPTVFHAHLSVSTDVVLAITVVAAALLAAKASWIRLRGAYFLLARIAFTTLVAALVMEFTSDRTILTLAISACLIGQCGLQWFASRPVAVHVVGEPALLRASLWLLLLTQLVVPLAYSMSAGGFSNGSAQRWAVGVELALLAVSAIVAQSVFKQRGASYLAIASVIGAAVVMEPILWPGTIALTLAVVSVGVVAWRSVYTPKAVEMRWYAIVATAAFLLTAAVLDYDNDAGILAVMWLVVGSALIVGAPVQKQLWLTLPGAIMVFLAAVLFRAQVMEMTNRAGVSSLAGFVIAVGILYLFRLVFWNAAPASRLQRGSLAGVAVFSGILFSFMAMADQNVILLGATAFTITATLASLETPVAQRRLIIDIAIVLGALVWFWASSIYVDLGFYWLVQWLAVALGALAMIRYVGKQVGVARGLLMGAASLATLGALMTIAGGDTVEQLVSLLLFVALLVVGMSVDSRVFTVWGAVGVTTAVLWYLRSYTYLLLAVLALALLGFVIWRLNRKRPAAPVGLLPAGLPPVGLPFERVPPASVPHAASGNFQPGQYPGAGAPPAPPQ